MRVLWFCGNSAMYRDDHVNGGWIAALQKEIVKVDNLTLGIAFHYSENAQKCNKESVVYYPICFQSLAIKLLRLISSEKADLHILQGFITAVNDFKPDIIHVWGSEMEYGLISKYIDVPVVLHIQGLLSPIYNLQYPNNVSLSRILLKPIKIQQKYQIIRNNIKYCAAREQEMLQSIKYVIGRTDWDKSCSYSINPNREYFYCSELLREDFFQSPKWEYKKNIKKIVITSVISDALYKGGDVILRACEIMKRLGLDFEWNVIGVSDFSTIETLTGIKYNNVNINNMGRRCAKDVISVLLSSDVFVHPSYIENSPNCVCEAQILGVPTISTSVGGTPSLVDNLKTGLLISTNDPYNLVGKILKLKKDQKLAETIGGNGMVVALKRHDKNSIISDLLTCYKKIIEK